MDEAARQTSSHSLSSASSYTSASVRRPGSSQRQHRRTGSVGTVSEHEVHNPSGQLSCGSISWSITGRQSHGKLAANLTAVLLLPPHSLVSSSSGAVIRPLVPLLCHLGIRHLCQLCVLHGFPGQRPPLRVRRPAAFRGIGSGASQHRGTDRHKPAGPPAVWSKSGPEIS